MKKLLLFTLLLGTLTNIKTMERQISAGRYLFGAEFPDELVVKIFNYANHGLDQAIIDKINEIIKENKIKFHGGEGLRHFEDPAFKQISHIIQAAPLNCYSVIGLSLALSNIFSIHEKMHFFSIMLMNKNLTSNQTVILYFLAERIKVFRYKTRFSQPEFKGTTGDDFTEWALMIGDSSKTETLLKFFVKNGLKLSNNTIGQLIRFQTKNAIPLVRWAISNGAVLDKPLINCIYEVIPLDYCRQQLSAWHNEKLTGECPGEEIDFMKKYYQELIELLEGCNSEKKQANEIEEFCPAEEILPF